MRTRKTRAHNFRLVRMFVFVLLLVAAFSAGFTLRGNSELLAKWGFPESVTGISKADTSNQKTADVYNSLSARVAEVEGILSNQSMDDYDLAEVTDVALNGFSTASSDPYLRYYSSDRYSALLKASTANYSGVGVLFSEYNGQAYAVDVFDGSTAQLSGVEAGDFVVAVDGDRSQNWSMSEVAAALNREDGSTVVVTWRRPDSLESQGGKEFTTTLTCHVYNVPNVTTSLDSNVGYISVKQFTRNSSDMVSQAIDDLTNQGATSLVLDLRDNPGGYLTQALDIANLFMNSGSVVQIQTTSGISVRTASGATKTRLPVVVLVNGNTSSSAEVLAAALKESQRATLVGTTTLGKGSVQVVQSLSFGGALRYTAAYYLTPQGHSIDKVGVTPNTEIAQSDSEDYQLSYAREIARSMATS